jgi:hypothetical protein
MSAVTNMEDEYDEYNYDQDKLVNSGHSGNIMNKIISASWSIHVLIYTLLTCFFTPLQVRIGVRKRLVNTPIISIQADTRENCQLNCKTLKPTGRKRIWSLILQPESDGIQALPPMSCNGFTYNFFLYFPK